MSKVAHDLGLIKKLFGDGDTAELQRALAKALRAGEPSRLLLDAIAAMIDPDQKNGPYYRLKLLRRRTGRPSGFPPGLTTLMVQMVDHKQNSIDEAAYQAEQRFGVGRRRALMALAEGRDMEKLVQWKQAGFSRDAYDRIFDDAKN